MATSRLDHGDETHYDTLERTIASQQYALAILLPCALGWAGQILLAGVVVALFVSYLHTEMYERDTGVRKMLLWTVVSVAVVQAGMNIASISYWMVRQERDALSLIHPTALDAIQTLSILINAPLVQGFLTMRAARLVTLRWARRLIVVAFGILIVLEIGAILFSTVLGILFHKNELSSGLLQAATYGLISGVWLVVAAVIDVAISVLLVLVLRRRIAGFNASTDGRLRALCRLALQSASYTALVAFMGFILTFATPFNNLLYACAPYAAWWLLSSCYALALLTTLSSRALILRKNSAQPVPPHMSEQRSPRAQALSGVASGSGSGGLSGAGRDRAARAAGEEAASGSASGSGSRAGTSRTVGERILGLGRDRGGGGGTPQSSSGDTMSASKRASPLPLHVATLGGVGVPRGGGDGGADGTSSGIQVDQEVSVHVDEHDVDDLVGLGFVESELRGGARTPRRRGIEMSAC
ncbi:uncharacterized protein RHOBADRAFT_55830 [Rhodotorula graminis WP1]|uniref:DUF6534 domain-containing protein n=1 Tax=Rhodotorula graminis (strain WP1) TaxID=578459 RepID=A0A0P9ISG8_RHOGW|nr:uncharacterized protein RHOBADRAFT_55830 [Rhodotorula graminis WP1]KPV72351.1 hypothetical protein RHOBADRAFT_55830 [Rhodotorula graminis WP1]